MHRWVVLISLLFNALFAPQLSTLCACPPSQATTTESCPCCAAGECDCGVAPSNPSSLPSKDSLILSRAGEAPPAHLESLPRFGFIPPRLPPARAPNHSTSLPLLASASEHRALLCQWQT